MTICPRCRHEQTSILAKSPVEGVWSLYQCNHCLYAWRSTEPLRRSHHEHYPAAFRIDPETVTHAEEIPAIPPLLAQS